MTTVRFFAIQGDLLPVIEIVESKAPLRYTLSGNFRAQDLQGGPRLLNSAVEIPNLGVASDKSASGCTAYLACECDTAVSLRRFQGNDGPRVCVDLLANPDAVMFTPAGQWNESVVLYGSVGATSGTKTSEALVRRFRSALKKVFTKVQTYFVGPRALELLKSGRRLTIAEQSPLEFDLQIDSTAS